MATKNKPKIGDRVLVHKSSKIDYDIEEFPIDYEGKEGVIEAISRDEIPYYIKFKDKGTECFKIEEITIIKTRKNLNGD